MSEAIKILQIIQNFSPMAAVALALFIILQLINQKKNVNTIKNNHLHELNDTLIRIEKKLDKLDDIQQSLTWLKAKQNIKDN